MTRARSAALTALVVVLGASPVAASAQDSWDWSGGGRADRRAYGLQGGGVGLLLPELRDSRRGQAFVIRNFDFDANGRINRREARAANRAFLGVAGADRSRFDWERRDRLVVRPDLVRPDLSRPDLPRPDRPRFGRGEWDRQGMRNYRFRQGRYGAMFVIEDVLFQTGSAVLRPAAVARLEPLAGYLEANPEARVRMDGHTDSVGSDASNLTLSRNRARAVADLLADTGVDPARLQLVGHGESAPIATNATAAGRQLNRRVEVTLVGARASDFD